MKKILIFLLAITSVIVCYAQEKKSFSRQMNELKRSGDYVYAESSAPSEADAKEACDALLKVEVSKYIASAIPDSDGKIIKNIGEYNRKYLVEPRGDMTRVFGYIAKKDIGVEKSKGKRESASQKKESSPETPKEEPATEVSVALPSEDAVDEPVAEAPAQEAAIQQESPAGATSDLHTDGLRLAKWQIEMLRTLADAPSLMEAKKTLNRFKTHNRVKRLGDRNVSNPRLTDSFFLVYDENGNLAAFLAPSQNSGHLDMLTGETKSLGNFAGLQYLWFQISK